jgi:ribose-phosphate pyrophosphokinase
VRARVVALPGNDVLAAALADRLDADLGGATIRSFPDGESYVRIEGDCTGRTLLLVCTLDRPDAKTLPLLLLAATARDLGVSRVGIVAPYLAYLRQDRRFLPGEGLTSTYFARLLSGAVDWLLTVDPHLHRLASLATLYTIPARAVHAAPLLAAWIRRHVPDAALVGPDAESTQWVAAVAEQAQVPHLVLEKVRHGDREVEVSLPAGPSWREHTPVIVDDIISTGHTMLATVGHLRRLGTPPPVCVGIHAVFADDAHAALLAAGAGRVVTTNTIPHPSNAIDVADLLANGAREMLDG